MSSDTEYGFDISNQQRPHCDDLCLHAPTLCVFCDMHPEEQQYRIDNNINFTGENDPNKKQCPAEARRNLSIINKWYGNVPKKPDQLEKELQELTNELNEEDKIDFDKYYGITKNKENK